MNLSKFDSIRSFLPEEMQTVIARLYRQPDIKQLLSLIVENVSSEILEEQLKACTSTDEFLKRIAFRMPQKIVEKTAFSIDISGRSKLVQGNVPYTYVTNHRDIVLDSAILNLLLLQIGYSFADIAIGDNLLKDEWIKDAVRLCGAFIVKRDVSGPKEMMENSLLLSEYIQYVLNERKHSVWIAQREGRAKNSDDRTQISLLKMLTMAGDCSLAEKIKNLNIAPVSISYEYDPCDYLKARELARKRSNPDYKKAPGEDVLNMRTGISGYKGRIHYSFCHTLNSMEDQWAHLTLKKDLLAKVAALIDHEIHYHYHLYPCNYIALDLLENTSAFKEHYSRDEKQKFEGYIAERIGLITKDSNEAFDTDFIRQAILEMYANPLRNYLTAHRS